MKDFSFKLDGNKFTFSFDLSKGKLAIFVLTKALFHVALWLAIKCKVLKVTVQKDTCNQDIVFSSQAAAQMFDRILGSNNYN